MSVALPALQSLVLLCCFCIPAWSTDSGEEGTGYMVVTEQQRKDYFAELPGDKATCRNSTAQSPVNVKTGQAITEPAPPHYVRYDQTVFLGNGIDSPIKKTAHNVEVGPVQRLNMPDGNDRWRDAALTFNPELRLVPNTNTPACTAGKYGTDTACQAWYRTRRDVPLASFHFHHPSEHLLDGKRYAMEMHLVFAQVFDSLASNQERGKLTNVPGKGIAVFGIFLDIVPDNQVDSNSPLREIFAAMSRPSGPGDVLGTFRIPNVTRLVDSKLHKLLPADTSYVRYHNGSLTTPDCRTGVTWFVFKTPLKVKQSEVDAFKALHEVNARPVQTFSGKFFANKFDFAPQQKPAGEN